MSWSKVETFKATRAALYASQFTQGDLVKIVVGPERRTYHLCKRLVEENCPFLTASFKACWNKGTASDTYRLDKAEPEVFEIIIDWLYEKKVPDYLTDVPDVKIQALTRLMVRTYKLADEFVMPVFQNALIDAHLSNNQKYSRIDPHSRLIDIAQADLCHTPLYQLVLKNAVRSFVSSNQTTEIKQRSVPELMAYPEVASDFLMKLAEYTTKGWEGIRPDEAGEYHMGVAVGGQADQNWES